MLLSLDWLREFTPYEGEAKTLADRLTMLGLEVEDIRDPFADIRAVVVGRVVTRDSHPDADKLSVCRVDIGQGEPLNIVCGAANVAAGQLVPVAVVGAVLPGGLGIKKSKIRGVESMGMICSEKELGLAESSEGIMVLPQGAPVGTPLPDALGLDSRVLDVSITPNRADCLCVLGLARETAMAFGLPLTLPEVRLVEDGPDASELTRIDIAEGELCPVYRARILRDVTVAPSPAWMRYRLLAIGQRPISNIVDVTNYVLFESGQPLHAFDRSLLAGDVIRVARSEPGRRFVTLDGQERVLDERDLLIWDAEKPVALAGVMGGAETEMRADSRDVLLECAVFKPASIRRTARRLGIPSESSYRFERGVDQVFSPWAMNRAAALMLETAGGRVLPGVAASEPRPFVPKRVAFRPERAKKLLGVDLGAAFCRDTLTALGCAVAEAADGAMAVTAPAHRLDIEREADLIEEVGRVYGLDRIPPVLPKVSKSLDETPKLSQFAFFARLRDWAVGAGLSEAVNYSFVGHEDLDRLDLPPTCRVAVANPLSEDQGVMRPMLAPGLLNAVRNNLAGGNAALRLFEAARVFVADAARETGCREPARLGLALHGPRYPESWPWPRAEAGYADLKGLVEHLCAALGLGVPTFERAGDRAWLSPDVAVFLDREPLGFIGQVRPDVADAFHARGALWLAELDADALMRAFEAKKTAFRPLPVYPPVKRDLTLTSPAGLAAGEVLAAIRAGGPGLLADVELFDVFEPEGADTRNLTFRLTYRHDGRTLTDKEVDKAHAAMLEAVREAVPVRFA